ncbi:TetR/AcrR family transcriptional regulator [Streptomyces sp. NBC_01390]|uniref:TetR/AcrR family transcriptional regulator n=1 Tax=Streptomyces sp. NBC_01390 TaxID=2903850 RepID=UPI00325061D4
MDKQPPSESRPGRKRSEESRMAILVAAFELVGEVGYAGLTIEGIANRAGCGKQTIYRWWPTKAHVLLEALAVKGDLYVTNADHGSYADDVRAFLGDMFGLSRQQRVVDVLCVLMAEAQINEEFGELFRSAFLQRRRDALEVILDRARTRGDLPPRPAASTVLDIVFGVLWYRLLATRRPMGDDLVEDLTATLTQAAQPPTNTVIDLGDQQ